MYIPSLHYNTEGRGKVAVCIYHHFIIKGKDEAKLRYVYIITLLSQGRMKKSCGMYISPFITTRKDKEKLRYVYISLPYNKEK